jgi:hypothetical protein
MLRLRICIPLFILAIIMSACAMLDPSSSDQAVLDSLRDAGSDMTKAHPIDFYLYHPDKTGADQICNRLRIDGFQVTVREGALGDEWLCLASMSFVPSIDRLSEIREKFEALIDLYGGEYDGWETIVIP